ncbi:MAG: hypothetical protein AAF639_39090 [Chloroflexota bacterium]
MTYQDQSLAQLRDDCQQQIKNYYKTSSQSQTKHEESRSCLEIVKRAANYAQDRLAREALGVLLEITETFVFARCPDKLADKREDIAQDVNLRLIKKFGNRSEPFRPTTFAAYRKYINVTTQSVISNLTREDRHPTIRKVYISELQGHSGEDNILVDSAPETAALLVQEEQAQIILRVLKNPLEAEAMIRRHAYDESVEEIAEAFSVSHKEMSREDVSRLLERAKARLLRDKGLRHRVQYDA